MWDSLYDTLHTFHQCGVSKGGSENHADSICVEFESAKKDATNPCEKLLVCESGELYTIEILVLLMIMCLINETNNGVNQKFELCRNTLESKGFGVSRSKIGHMHLKFCPHEKSEVEVRLDDIAVSNCNFL